jgi:hypothetical protein
MAYSKLPSFSRPLLPKAAPPQRRWLSPRVASGAALALIVIGTAGSPSPMRCKWKAAEASDLRTCLCTLSLPALGAYVDTPSEPERALLNLLIVSCRIHTAVRSLAS